SRRTHRASSREKQPEVFGVARELSGKTSQERRTFGRLWGGIAGFATAKYEVVELIGASVPPTLRISFYYLPLSGTSPRNFIMGSTDGLAPRHASYIFSRASVFPRDKIILRKRSPF